MRIIGGKFKGRRLVGVSDATTRPTTDRVRENVFNILGTKVRGAAVLDVFSGTGAYAAESLSRGAASVVANDIDVGAQQLMRRNLGELTDRVKIWGLGYMELLNNLRGNKFDIVFLDAPYDSNFATQCVTFLFSQNMLETGAVVVVETDKDLNFEGYSVRTKKYGRARIYFLRMK